MLPATSFARTVYEYAVAAVRPVSEYDVDVVEPTFVVPRYTSYPARPEPPVLSVDAAQDSVRLFWVTALAARPVGTLGAVVSVGVGLGGDRTGPTTRRTRCPRRPWPGRCTSTPWTAVSPVSVNDVVVEVPTFVVPR